MPPFKKEFRDLLLCKFRDKVFISEPLSRHTTFGLGGPADIFMNINSPIELYYVLKRIREFRMPFFILGSGSNLLVNDRGFRGIVLKLDMSDITRTGEDEILVLCGTRLSEVVEYCRDNAKSGLEFAAGIPGTFGGAVAGNAGAYGKSISDVFACGTVFDTYRLETLHVKSEDLEFSYRHSNLKATNQILLDGVLKLAKGDRMKIQESIDEILALRNAKHPDESIGNAGSFFKNLDNQAPDESRIAAGKILESCGAKQQSSGGASVFEKHANFIINAAGATASDVLELARKLKSLVREKTGISLEPEVVFLGEYGIEHPLD